MSTGVNPRHELRGVVKDDEVLRKAIEVFDKSASRTTPNAQTEAWTVIRAAVAALQAERDALRDDVKLLTHKVITCGVAAANPDPELSSSGPYGGEWDSPQAQDVRALRSRADALEALRGQVAGLLNTCVDVIEEGLCASQSYDYRARAQGCAEQIKELLAIKEGMG